MDHERYYIQAIQNTSHRRTMGTLKPEKRMDKTGRIVTRHVKDDTATPSPASFPPPVTPSSKTDMIIIPGQEKIPMTKADFAIIGDLLDRCGSYNSDDLMHITPYIRDGDMDTLRVFHKYSDEYSYSGIIDVLSATYDLYPDKDYAGTIEAHLKIAASGAFDYYDIAGVPEYEAVLRVIHDNTEQADSIIVFLNERGPDAGALTEYLANDVKAVREGTL